MTALKATTASKRRAVAVVALAAGAALALTGCSAGQISQTASQVAAVNGNSADVGKIALRDVRILLPQSEEYNNAKGGKALLAFSAINSGEYQGDTLVSIEAPELGTVKIDGKAEIKPQAILVADQPKSEAAGHDEHGAQPADEHGTTTTTTTTAAPAPASNPEDQVADPAANPLKIEITGLQKDVTAGLTYPVRFNFKESGTVLVNVPVDAGIEKERAVTDKSGAEEKGGESKGGH
ncbi:hypothetical protein [Nocardia sp. NPDC050406]|uniref:hypothetical protein n=1 Tax=Nocardia sp. NPDC050406 TaxID=3364318 RepID=UPI00378C4A7B